MEEKQVNHIEDQEVDLVEMGRFIWNKRKFLFKLCGIAVAIGLIIAFSLPKEYTTNVMIVPEASAVSRSPGGLGGLAAIAGINLNQRSGDDAIMPSLYPDVVQSTPFLLELFQVEVADKEKYFEGTLYKYMLQYQKTPWWTSALQAPFKLVSSLLRKKDTPSEVIDPFALTTEQAGVKTNMQKRITVSIAQKSSTVTLSVKMQDPQIAAQVAEVVLKNLQKYITDYRTRKAKKDLEFTEKVFADARKNYLDALHTVARFEDRNRNIATAGYQTEIERLRNEMTIAFNVYNSLAQKLEQDKLKVQEQTPVYAVIEPPTVPVRPASPGKMMILIISFFVGLCVGLGWILLKNLFGQQNSSQKDKQSEGDYSKDKQPV
ncbi:chain-length determining protein [Parabacteroides sp. OttesenSCG-928-G06]|nr:chain-length determining protein [Parabacteroides sp. OttesenSCG-928-K15]MDL2281725.1 chain-length determining protein [Parabacteroides sp. OttesenSCG-928-G06]